MAGRGGADLRDVVVGASQARDDLAAKQLPRRSCRRAAAGAIDFQISRARRVGPVGSAEEATRNQGLDGNDTVLNYMIKERGREPGSSVLNGARSMETRTSSCTKVWERICFSVQRRPDICETSICGPLSSDHICSALRFQQESGPRGSLEMNRAF